jgi:hypothetical protein
MRTLPNYSIKPDSEAFILQLEDEAGHIVELIVSAEQLDALIQEASSCTRRSSARWTARTELGGRRRDPNLARHAGTSAT